VILGPPSDHPPVEMFDVQYKYKLTGFTWLPVTRLSMGEYPIHIATDKWDEQVFRKEETVSHVRLLLHPHRLLCHNSYG